MTDKIDHTEYHLKGANALELNQTSMVRIVQMWVDTVMIGNTLVRSIKSQSNGGSTTFTVEMISGGSQND